MKPDMLLFLTATMFASTKSSQQLQLHVDRPVLATPASYLVQHANVHHG
jgi:hypothetical protein